MPNSEAANRHALSGPLAAGTTGTFVGRSHELQEMGTALTEALAGSGRLILLVGQAGIGKTRLAEELAREARGRGVDVVWGRCWEGGGAPAYWPWVQILRTVIPSLGTGWPTQVGLAASYIGEMLPELRPE